MGRWVWIGVFLCACLLGGLAVAGASPAGTATAAPGEQATQEFDASVAQADEHDRLQLRLTVQADGDVVWTYRYVYPIEDSEERAAFEDYAERFESEETTLYRQFRNQSEALTSSAATHLDREMAAVDYDRSATIGATPTGEVGHVELTFRWTNFGVVGDDTVTVGDVFEGGFYLSAGQSLVFEAGESLRFESIEPVDSAAATPTPERQTATWMGEQEFADGHPSATFSVDSADGGATDDATNEQTEASGAAMLGGTGGSMLLGGGLLALVVALLALAFARDELPAIGPFGGADSASTAPATAETASTDATETESVPAEDSDPEEVPASISDDERVQQLLEDEDGRMKQSVIVEETGWSKSKVSMLLTDMEDDGIISKIQVGRENIIALEGHEPDAVGSPFDDE